MELSVSIDPDATLANCFVGLPPTLAQNLIDHPLYPLIPLTIHRKASPPLHASFTGHLSPTPTSLTLPLSFANLQNPPFKPSEPIKLTIHNQPPPPATELTLTPKTTSDYDIITLHATYFETTILNQINIIYPNLTFPLKLPSRSTLSLTITSTLPPPTNLHPFSKLTRGSKLIILPPPLPNPPQQPTHHQNQSTKILRVLPQKQTSSPHKAILNPSTFSQNNNNNPQFITLLTPTFTITLPLSYDTNIPANYILLALYTRTLLNTPILSYVKSKIVTPLPSPGFPVSTITVVVIGDDEGILKRGGVSAREVLEGVISVDDDDDDDGVVVDDGGVFRYGGLFVRVWFGGEREGMWRKGWERRRGFGWVGVWDREGDVEGDGEGGEEGGGVVLRKGGEVEGVVGRRWVVDKRVCGKVGVRWGERERVGGLEGFDGGWGGVGMEGVRGGGGLRCFGRLVEKVGGVGVRVVGLVGDKGMGKSRVLECLGGRLREGEGFYKTVWLRGRVHAGEKTRRTVKRIKDLFAASVLYAPAAVFVDDGDELLGSRWGPSSSTQNVAGGDAGDNDEDEKFGNENEDNVNGRSNTLASGDMVDEKAMDRLDDDIRKELDENDMISAASRYWIAETFVTCIREIQKMKPQPDIVVVISFSQFSHLHPLVRSMIHPANRIYLPPPSDRDRAAILASFVESLSPELKVCISQAAEATAHFSPRDLQRLVHRSTVVCKSEPSVNGTSNEQDKENQLSSFSCLNDTTNPVILSTDKNTGKMRMKVSGDLLVANAKTLIPESRFGLVLDEADDSNAPSVTFSDIGGLKRAKMSIIETLNLTVNLDDEHDDDDDDDVNSISPLVMKSILENAPIPLARHLFIYGPPGCGKTLLTKAISSTRQMKTITVLGPSLLSKYVGGSEQAVRDLFKRANSARPCVIVIEEIDAICPPRGGSGASSSGVVERVVNMFLAILDGAGRRLSRDVYVIGVTNRPDFVDKALLRPGRLGKHVWVGFPGVEERMEILRCLLKGEKGVEEGVVEKVAEITEGWTGADLRGIVVEARLEMVRGEGTVLKLVDCVELVQPSVGKRERERWEGIRRRWDGDSGDGEEEREGENGLVMGMDDLKIGDDDGNGLKERVALR